MATKPVWTTQQVVDQMLRLDYQWQTPTVNYAFASSFNATEKAATALAFQYFADIINLNFAEVSPGASGGKITFSNASLSPGLWGLSNWSYSTIQNNGHFPMLNATVQVNTNYTGVTSSYAFGSYDFMSIFHEIGHSLGLAHPGDYDEGGASYSTDALFFQDSRQYTVMSYFDAANTGGNHGGYYASTPLLYDVASLQALYGANMTTRTGDTTYGFNNTSGRAAFDFTVDLHPVVSVWDAGGNDTVDLSGYSMACKLDLNQGAFSDVGGLIGNFSICLGATIENGVGGSGSDQLIGNSSNNNLSGGDGNDTLNPGTGADTVDGGNGNDTFVFGADFDPLDSVAGGAGTDTLSLNGDYLSPLTLSTTSLTGIEAVSLGAGHSYSFIMADGNVGAGGTLTIDASALGSANSLVVDGTLELDGKLNLVGGAGNDLLTGGFGADTLNGGTAGNDVLVGGGGNDTFAFAAGFNASDTVKGGTGNDTLSLNGDYGAVVFGIATMIEVESIVLAAAHSYNLTLDNLNVGLGATLSVNASALASTNALTFNASNVLLGQVNVTGGAGADKLTASHGADVMNGGAGNDSFTFGANFTSADSVVGGAGVDTMFLDGAYSLAFTATMMSEVETLTLAAGHRYVLTLSDANVASGARLTVNANTLGANDSVVVDGSGETNGKFTVNGGAGNDSMTGGVLSDIFVGGAGNDNLSGGGGGDSLTGGLGADTMNGGLGADIFVYGSFKESTSSTYDTLVGFDFASDRIDLTTAVTGIDASLSGLLSSLTFDLDMAGIVGKRQLQVNHALVVTASGGTLAGEKFLVVDMNGKAGYQPGKDLVINIDDSLHLTSLDIADFM